MPWVGLRSAVWTFLGQTHFILECFACDGGQLLYSYWADFYGLLNEIMSTNPGLEVIKLEYRLRLKIKRNDRLLADKCPQAANHCALF